MKKDKVKDNLQFWKSVEVTPSSWLKNATINGNKIKAINPQKQLKQATKSFGSYGSTWGLKDCKRSVIEFEETVKLLFLECTFFYPEGEFQISNMQKLCYTSSKGRYIVDDEAPKKLETNTISKALSKLGFASDVFEGRFDKAGYNKIVDYALEPELSQAEVKAACKALKLSKKSLDLAKLWNNQKSWHNSTKIAECYKDNLQTLQILEQ